VHYFARGNKVTVAVVFNKYFVLFWTHLIELIITPRRVHAHIVVITA